MHDTPSTRSVLTVLTKLRLLELARDLEVAVPAGKKELQVDGLLASGRLAFRGIVERLGRDELRAVCAAHGLSASSRSRTELAGSLLEAHGNVDTVPPKPLFASRAEERWLPRERDIVLVRRRQWLVERVARGGEDEATRVSLVCLDDDNAGQTLDVLWEIELGAQVIQPETKGLGEVSGFDSPHAFGSYLLALRWNLVTATDARLFQSPFRAGIKILTHQLTPLRKALALPRANLFIADDVGLGKTIEAGLVLSELVLRQRVDFALIVCPASVAVQWQGEMERRFGLRFEIFSRAFVAASHRERGFAVPPWSTFHRFIITYQTLRRPEYLEPLLQQLGERARKSLLILDEAHSAAPATASAYAVDSNTTKVVRELARRFDNRLFLSATPHNGHSNSFAALLEILDPQRFTRTRSPGDPSALEPVMVRRLKSDLRALPNTGSFPERRVVRLAVGSPDTPEVVLSSMLAEYTELVAPERGRGRLVFVNLQKRLLSSIAAFASTLEVHAESATGKKVVALGAEDEPGEDERDDEPYGEDDETENARLASEVRQATRALGERAAGERPRELLASMRALAGTHARAPDEKMKALRTWIAEHQCAAVALDPEARRKAPATARRWTDTRVIVFTEYADTKNAIVRYLRAAADGTDGGEDRVLELAGGIGDERRDAIQRAFNGPPAEHPVRVLVCTDAAREGLNLQAYCADLFHVDVPWNPGRMEQRNGRIDRTLQPAETVRCHYFVYPDRAEDRVLEVLVEKVQTIEKELGSLGAVIAEELGTTLARGIGKGTREALDAAGSPARRSKIRAELESARGIDRLRAEIDEAGSILKSSRKLLAFQPELLRRVLDEGLALAGAGPLTPLPAEGDGPARFALPELPESWTPVVDGMRPARGADEPEHVWRRRPPRPVVLEAPEVWSDSTVHVHLEHPFVQRILTRFRAQGFSAHDLSRVTVLPTRADDEVRAVAIGRLSLFGPRATRLHDELVVVAAPWFESARDGHLVPRSAKEDAEAVRDIESALLALPAGRSKKHEALERSLVPHAAKDFAALWRFVTEEADARALAAEQKLKARAREEATALSKILEAQRTTLERELAGRQLTLDLAPGDRDAEKQRDQWEADRRHLERRRRELEKEREEEPRALEALYAVARRRLVPVGLVYLWPETRG
ncbi:MAG: DISARM system SNF2-like helicase DrmD [Labilithrix sp.]|nr:DISARM system SNF2-like helicase DrmD [Labilithrix sp.]MCW5817003.1 DISARM system SNF2-like helicase DrmD [Labilithrix sp.]